MLLSLFSVASAAEESETSVIVGRVQEYETATRPRKLEMLNQLYKDYVEEAEDTLYVADSRTPDFFVDAMYYYWSAEFVRDKSDYEHAMLWYKQAEMLLEKSDSLVAYADCLAGITANYCRLSDFVSASEYAERVLTLDRASGDLCKISSSLSNIASIWIYANQPDVAEKYILEALEIERQLDRPKILSIRLGIASECYVQMKQLDTALEMAREALSVESESGSVQKIPVRQSQLSSVLSEMQRFDEARDYALLAVEGLRQTGNTTSLGITLRELARIERATGHEDLAIQYLKESLEISHQTGNKFQEAKICRHLSDILKDRDPKLSLQYMMDYAALNEQMFNDKLAQDLQSFNVKYETTQKQYQLEVQAKQLANQRLLMGLIVAALVICLVGAFLLWRLAKARGETNQILRHASAAKDELIRIANEEKLQAETARQQILQVADRISALTDVSDTELTSREVQIIQLFAKGLMSKEVAEQLNISVRTVETHKNHIYKKLKIGTTIELLHFAQQKGLV